LLFVSLVTKLQIKKTHFLCNSFTQKVSFFEQQEYEKLMLIILIPAKKLIVHHR